MLQFVRIFTRVASHPKFQIAGPEASWLWLLGLIYSRNMESDGRIPRASLGALGYQHDHATAVADRLVRAGLWEIDGDGWRIHDYLDFNYSAQQIADLRAQKRIHGAKGGHAKAARSTVPNRGVAQSQNTAWQPPSRLLNHDLARVEPNSSNKQQAKTDISGVFPRRRLDAAWEGARVWVPQRIHTDFVQFLNKPEAEKELLTWYEAVDLDWSRGAHQSSPTGSDMFAYWRARFNERWPAATTSTRKRPAWAIEAES